MSGAHSCSAFSLRILVFDVLFIQSVCLVLGESTVTWFASSIGRFSEIRASIDRAATASAGYSCVAGVRDGRERLCRSSARAASGTHFVRVQAVRGNVLVPDAGIRRTDCPDGHGRQ